MNICCFPGLAFDHRIFANLEWGEHIPQYIDWIEPQTNESFSSYAARIANLIPNESNELVLIGHSLGGMLAQEIAAQRNTKQVFLISSVRSRKEIPWFFKILKPRFLHRFFTQSLVSHTFPYWARFHDYESQEEQQLFLEMVAKHSNNYLKWALGNLTKWETPSLPSTTTIFQIHGMQDRTLPCKLLKQPDQVVPDAGHFMVVKRPHIVSQFIFSNLEST